jgi:hypothetical protein
MHINLRHAFTSIALLTTCLGGCAAQIEADETTDDDLATAGISSVTVARSSSAGFLPGGPNRCAPGRIDLKVAFAGEGAKISGSYCSAQQILTLDRALQPAELVSVRKALRAVKILRSGSRAPDAPQVEIDVRSGSVEKKYTDEINAIPGRVPVRNGFELADVINDVALAGVPELGVCDATHRCGPNLHCQKFPGRIGGPGQCRSND